MAARPRTKTAPRQRGTRNSVPVNSAMPPASLGAPEFKDNFDVVPDSPPEANLSPGQVRQEWDSRMDHVRKSLLGDWFRVMLSGNKKAVAYRKQYLQGIYGKEFEVVARQTPEGLFGIWVKFLGKPQ